VYYMASVLKRFALKEMQAVLATPLHAERPITRRAKLLSSSDIDLSEDCLFSSPPLSPALNASTSSTEAPEIKRARGVCAHGDIVVHQ
jgi:hypothetical protein